MSQDGSSTTPSSPIGSPTSPTRMMGLTTNYSPTFLTTGNPCLDFFFHIVPDTPRDRLTELLQSAWAHDPLKTLKLVSHLRGVRGTGKSDKENFYVAALWLHDHHPKTLALNIRWFGEFGYLKDLPEILYRILEGLDVRQDAKVERAVAPIYWVRGKRKLRTEPYYTYRKGEKVKLQKSPFVKPKPKNADVDSIDEKMKTLSAEENPKVPTTEEEMKTLDVDNEDDIDSENPKVPKKKNAEELKKKLTERYTTDPNYNFLYDEICSVFGKLLVADVEFMKSKEYKKISLAAKWCPSLETSYDRSLLICDSIAKNVFPRESEPSYEKIEEAKYVYIIRNRLRKEVLSPLRQVLQIPEAYMSAKKWDVLPYERVPSVAMKKYKKFFAEHDSERFTKYLEKVKKGEKKIAAGALLPHEILDSLDEDEEGEQSAEVAELQWKRMVEDLLAKGSLNNCMAVCDVSGSMSGMPMKVCIALGILISELSEDPWKGQLITFSAEPTLQTVQGETLKEKKQFVQDMDWGMNTDFQKVFDLILDVAVKGKLSESDMVTRVFVFSDMEFDQASENDWETDYHAIQRKFSENGYGSAVPEIVFWNLRDSRATPVAAKQKGVALVSGYSKNMLNLFLAGDDNLDPETIMDSAISGAEYNTLKVYD